MIDVNLLPEQKVSSLYEDKIKRYCTLGAVIFSVIWIGGLLLLFGYTQFQNKQRADLEARKTTASDQLAALNPLAEDLMSVKLKAKGIEYVQKSRFDFPNSLAYAFKIFPQGVDITKISIQDSGQVILGGKSANWRLMGAFLTKIAADPVLKYPTLTTLKYNEQGDFIMSVAAFYGERKPTTVVN